MFGGNPTIADPEEQLQTYHFHLWGEVGCEVEVEVSRPAGVGVDVSIIGGYDGHVEIMSAS
jgi:hypothetical protein